MGEGKSGVGSARGTHALGCLRAHTEYSLEIAYERQGNRVARAARRRENMGSAIWWERREDRCQKLLRVHIGVARYSHTEAHKFPRTSTPQRIAVASTQAHRRRHSRHRSTRRA